MKSFLAICLLLVSANSFAANSTISTAPTSTTPGEEISRSINKEEAANHAMVLSSFRKAFACQFTDSALANAYQPEAPSDALVLDTVRGADTMYELIIAGGNLRRCFANSKKDNADKMGNTRYKVCLFIKGENELSFVNVAIEKYKNVNLGTLRNPKIETQWAVETGYSCR